MGLVVQAAMGDCERFAEMIDAHSCQERADVDNLNRLLNLSSLEWYRL